MSSLSWARVRLENLTKKVGSGATPKGGESSYEKTGTPLIRSMNVVFFGFKRNGLAYLNRQQAEALKGAAVQANDVLLNITGASIGRVTLAPQDMDGARVNQHVCIIRPNDAIEPRFLRAFLSSPKMQNEITAENYGVTRQALTKQQILDFIVQVAPLPEQSRIADKLDNLLARVDVCRHRLDRVPAILKRFRQSVLAAAISGELTKEWREQSGIDKDAPQPRTSLGSLCEQSFYGPRFGVGDYSHKGVPTIRTTDMTRDGRIEITSGTPRVEIPTEKLKQFEVRKGDLLVTRTGSIGMMAVFDGDYTAIPSAYLIRFRFSKRVLPRFVFFCLMAPEGQEQLGLSTTATTQPNINAEAIKRINIPLPELAEQHETIRRTDELLAIADRVEARHHSGLRLLERLSPCIVAKAFRGELVPQDPNDEPASVLLDRIRAERVTTGQHQLRRGQRTAPEDQADPSKSSSTPTPKSDSSTQTAPPRPRRPPEREPEPEDAAALPGRRPLDDYTTDEMMSHFRAASRGSGEMTEEGLFHLVLARLGFERLGTKVTPILKGHLKAAIGRGIIERDGFFVRCKTPTILRYERPVLVDALTSVMRKNHPYEREEVIQALAVHLGYSSVSDAMRETMKSIFNSAIRQGVLIREGSTITRGD